MTKTALQIYQVVEIQLEGKTLMGRVRALSDREFTVEPMGRSEVDALLHEGVAVDVFFAAADAMYRLSTVVTSVLSQPVRRLYFERDDDRLVRIQRREYFRVDARVEVRYGLPGVEANLAGEMDQEGSTRDISAGGALLELAERCEPGMLIQVVMFLPDGGDPLPVVGRVIRAQEEDGVCLVGVEYLALTEKERSRITRLLFRLQADAASA